MKRTLIWALVGVLWGIGCGNDQTAKVSAAAEGSGQAAAKVIAGRGIMPAVTVKKGPAIDGTMKDPVWRKCPPMPLGECMTKNPGPMATTARVLFDATTLYVGFHCAETDTDGLKADETQRDGGVWKDDSVEVFITGDIRTGYYHFSVNPAGTLFDAKCTGQKRDDTSYNSGAKVKTSTVKGKAWIVTMSIPLKDLGAYVGAGQDWICNLNRTRPARGGQAVVEWSWSIMGSNDYHQMADFGQIKGVNVPSRTDGVTRKATRPPKPPSYEKGEEKGGVTVYRHLPKLDIPDKGQGTSHEIPMKIRGSKGLKVAFLARGVGGVASVPFNMSDRRSNDNTTSYAYRTVTDQWRPLVYFCDRFRYNSNLNRVAANTDYANIRFHGNNTGGKGALHLRHVAVYRGEDTAPPSAPTGLKAKAGAAGIRLTWTEPADNVAVASYAVSRAGQDGKFKKIAHVYVNEYVDRPVEAGKHTYRVLAVDFQDNLSPWSKTASARGTKTFQAPKPSDLQTDRAGYADNVRKIAAAGKVRKGWVLCFGDSITGATSYRVFTESALGQYRVDANGRAGWTTGGCRKVIESDLKRSNPQFCLIMLGTNNSKNPKALPQAMDDLLFMAKACAANGTVPIITTIPPRGFGDPASKPEAGYNDLLIKTCRDNKIPIAYTFKAFQAGGDRRKLLAGDGVHLVDGGWAVTGPAWRAALEQVNFVLLDRPD